DGGDGGDVGVAPGRIDKHAGGADFAVTGRAVPNIDVAAGIQRDASWGGQAGGHGRADGGDWALVERPGAASHRRIDQHAIDVRHIDVAAGIQRDAFQVFVAPADGGGGGLVAVAPRRIDKHHPGAFIGHIDVAAGIQRDADWVGQAGVAPADDGGGGLVAVAPRRINKHAGGKIYGTVTGIRHIDVAAGIHRDAGWGDQVGVAPADDGGGGGVAVAPFGVNGEGLVAEVEGVNVPTRVNGHESRVGEAGRRRG